MKIIRDVKKSVRFSREMVKMIEKRAAIEEKTLSEIIVNSCHFYLVQEEEEEKRWEIILKRLTRQLTEIKSLREDVRVCIAAIDGFSRFFFAYQSKIPEAEWESAELNSAEAHERMMEFILDNIRKDGGLIETLKKLEEVEEEE